MNDLQLLEKDYEALVEVVRHLEKVIIYKNRKIKDLEDKIEAIEEAREEEAALIERQNDDIFEMAERIVELEKILKNK